MKFIYLFPFKIVYLPLAPVPLAWKALDCLADFSFGALALAADLAFSFLSLSCLVLLIIEIKWFDKKTNKKKIKKHTLSFQRYEQLFHQEFPS